MSKNDRKDILFPVGRYVQGSLYEPQTDDMEGRPLTFSKGPQAGQPRVSFYFGLAIKKGAEQHWAQTEWGAMIYAIAKEGFPSGQTQSSSFAWKITDGDSTIPNAKGTVPANREGFPGHWVLHFTNGFEPKILNFDGSKYLVEKDAVKLGDYLEVYGSVAPNGETTKPGIYINHSHVALAGTGERIVLGIDPKSVGFGKGPLPAGANQVPTGAAFGTPATAQFVPPTFAPPPSNVAPPTFVPPTNPTYPPSGVAPYPAILGVPGVSPPPAPVQRVMLPAAEGFTYEQYIAGGWTDEKLIQMGKMAA